MLRLSKPLEIMRGTGTFILSTLALAVVLGGVTAQGQSEYLPLHTGNQWIYRGADVAVRDLHVIEITGAETIEGRRYAVVQWFFGQRALLRYDAAGTLLAYDATQRRDVVWSAFGAAEGESYRTEIDPCNSRATIASRRAKYTGPIGEFEYALNINYPTLECADAGISGEFYLPHIGLLRRTLSTIAGPRHYDLVYARIGGVTVVSEGEASFALSLDRSIYRPGTTPAPITARLTLRNTRPEPLRLNFGSGQTYEFVIRNDKDEVVYRWSDGKAFTLALRSEEFGPGERNYGILAPVPAAEGAYVAEAWLTTLGQRKFVASTGFEVRP